MSIRAKALALANAAHHMQYRKDGRTPYIHHPIAVAEIAEKKVYPFSILGVSNEDVEAVIFAIAVLHDTIEDTWVTKEKIKETFDNSHIGDVIAGTVSVLSKGEGENYLDFILRCKHDPLATHIKLADLQHNMSDLKEGSLKDKYRLAEYILNESSSFQS